MIPLPCDDNECTYMACCGKLICNGCRYCLTRNCCPFCNTAASCSHEVIKKVSERIESYIDPAAMVMLSGFYSNGQHGLPVDQSKKLELLQRASELGSAMAHYNLGILYKMGIGTDINMKKSIHHWQIATIMGQVNARNNLGYAELQNGNYQRAMKHFMIAAKCGFKDSLDNVKQGFRDGLVTKEDFEKTLRDYQAIYEETKSEQRDRAAAIIAREK
eukprot:scaffold11800_cov27-Cyclotella_meneghiniana.AAC.2